ncbi:MAG: aminodeoxychorismate lyase, partial [Alphaproteobacteria bacterium]
AGRLCAGHGRCVLKIIVTRGAGGRGYRPPERPVPTRILSRHPWPDYALAAWREGVVARVCTTRLATQPLLAGIKHLNRLEQVMARREWDDPVISEGLMLDTDGFVVDGTMSNLFIVAGGRLATPDLSLCGVAGVMRAVVLEAAAKLEVPAEVIRITLDRVRAADEVFLTNSLIGIWPVRELDGTRYRLGGLARRLAEEVEAVSARSPVSERA